MCEDEDCGCHKKHHQGHHKQYHHHHGYRGYATIAKRTGETVNIPEILFEVANIKEGDFFKIYVRKLKKHEH
jgi:recombinational DNA repair protein RecT